MCIQNEILYLILLVKENLFTTINIKGTFLMTWNVCVWYFVKRDCIMIVIFDSSFNLNQFVESRFLFCCCYCSCCCWNDDDVCQSNTVRSFLPSFLPSARPYSSFLLKSATLSTSSEVVVSADFFASCIAVSIRDIEFELLFKKSFRKLS